MTEGRPDATSFGRCAGSYESGRPEYPAAAVEWLLEPLDPSRRRPRVADVGAGTGKLTRALLAAGCEVVAVDPDPDMLQTLRECVPGVTAVLLGSAESLPLEDRSVDAVTLGQAWHWVDPVGASREIARVLRPGGSLGLLWNLRDDSQLWMSRLAAVMPRGRAAAMLEAGSPPVAGPFEELQERTPGDGHARSRAPPSWTWPAHAPPSSPRPPSNGPSTSGTSRRSSMRPRSPKGPPSRSHTSPAATGHAGDGPGSLTPGHAGP